MTKGGGMVKKEKVILMTRLAIEEKTDPRYRFITGSFWFDDYASKELWEAFFAISFAYALVVGGIIDHYALDYVGRHASIPAVEDFHFNEYEDFVEFAKKQEFDYRSSAMAYFDQMKKELEKDGMAEGAKEQLEALKTVIDRDKEQFLRDSKEELIPFIEEEIAVRYWFQEAGIQVRLRYDDQLKAALEKPMIKF